MTFTVKYRRNNGSQKEGPKRETLRKEVLSLAAFVVSQNDWIVGKSIIFGGLRNETALH